MSEVVTLRFTCAAVCAAGPSYYELLGLDVSADEKAVQKNFRRVSLKNHPDKDPSAAAAARCAPSHPRATFHAPLGLGKAAIAVLKCLVLP